MSDCSLATPRTLARGIGDGRAYELLFDLMAPVHVIEILCNPSKFQEAHIEYV